jgi:hypothetical protein
VCVRNVLVQLSIADVEPTECPFGICLGGDIRRFEYFQLGFDVQVVTVRANTVTELGTGMFGDVVLNRLPVVLIVANVLAVRADRQQPLQGLDLV